MASQRQLLTNVLRAEWNRFLSPIHPSKSDEPENAKPVHKIGHQSGVLPGGLTANGFVSDTSQHAASSHIGITLEDLRGELCHPRTLASSFIPVPRVEKAVATCEVSVQTDAPVAVASCVEHTLHEETYGSDLLNAVGCDLLKKTRIAEAISVFKAALKNGEHADALYNLGLCHASEHNCDQDMPKAVECWSQAGELKHAPAQYQLAVAHLRGMGVDKNSAKGLALMNRAAHGGCMDAVWYLFVHSIKKADFRTAEGLLVPLVCSEDHRGQLVNAAQSVGFPAAFKRTVLNSVYACIYPPKSSVGC